MPLHLNCCVMLSLVVFCVCNSVSAQQGELVTAPQPDKTIVATGIERIAAIDLTSQIQYVRLTLEGTLRAAAKGVPDPPAPAPPSRLVAQCTLQPNGKHLFEVFATFGGAPEAAFSPPWKPSATSPFPPHSEKVSITMDFLGYTHVKPLRRQWEIPVKAPGYYRYNPPGGGSTNLEEIAYDLRYMLSLPTLRLTLCSSAAEFLTTPLLDAIRKEPLCQAAAI